MIRRQFRGWCGFFCGFILFIFIALGIVYGSFDRAFAVNNGVEEARQNTAVKVLAKNLSDCYKNARSEIEFSSEEAWNYKSKVYWDDPNMQVYYPKFLAGKTGNEASSNCSKMITGWNSNWIVELFTERGDFKGVKQGVVVPGDIDNAEYYATGNWTGAMEEYLNGVGYKAEKKSSNMLNGYRCFYFILTGYQSVFSGNMPKTVDSDGNPLLISNEIFCLAVENGGDEVKVDKNILDIKFGTEDDGKVIVRDEEKTHEKVAFSRPIDAWDTFKVDKKKKVVQFSPYNIYNYYIGSNGRGIGEEVAYIDEGTRSCTFGSDGKISFSALMSGMESCVKKMTTTNIWGEKLGKIFRSVSVKEVDLGNANATFKKGSEENFVNYFFDQSGKDIVKNGYALSTAEQYMFYYDHLVNYFGKDLTSNYLYDNENAASNTVGVLWLNENDKTFSKKYISMPDSVTKTACALDGDVWSGDCGGNEHDWKYFAEKLGSFTEEELVAAFENIDLLDPDYANDNPGEDSDDGIHACYSGSGPLGWILCPVIDSINSIGSWMWSNIIEYHLKIDAVEIFENGGAVEQAWGIMRNIANTFFIVLFIVVIFSQLTGVGIDNYGIKKILPRLIVVALLINLSYIICELAVDLSNIFGVGLKDMLSNFATLSTGQTENPNVAAGALDVALGVGGLGLFALLSNPVGATSLIAVAATAGLIVLGVILTMMIAVATLYIILVIREAGIILLIVLSPVALACYMLPNTEKLYKKWFDLFKALLIVYPICGMMIGAGKLAGSVLGSIGGANGPTSMKIAAMIVQVLPFFLIPKLLKSSLALMGNVGAKISSMSQGLRNKGGAKVQGAVKGSERFKNWSQYQQEKTAANRAGRVQARLRNRMASGKTLSTREQDKLRKADDTVLAWQSREKVNARRTSEQSYAAREAAIETENEKAKVADYESLLENGRAFEADGVTAVNINDPNSVGRYHAEALARYEAATSDAERGEAMSQIKAAQNILSKTDKGRAQVQNNLETALKNGQVAGLSGASAHLMGNFGDTYKSKNRGAHKMIQDLATTDLSKSATLTGLQSKLTNGDYAFAGTGKYTAESLAGADDAALDRFVDGVNNGSLTGNELANIQATAYEALQKSKSGTLNIKPEVSRKLEQIIGSNYVPAAMPNNRATVLSHGAYEDSAGNVAHLREMSNGKYLDDGDFEVDITHYKKR